MLVAHCVSSNNKLVQNLLVTRLNLVLVLLPCQILFYDSLRATFSQAETRNLVKYSSCGSQHCQVEFSQIIIVT